MGRVGTDCKPRATNGLLEGDTGHFRRWRVGNKMHHHGGEVLINNLGKNMMATKVAGYGNRSRRGVSTE